MLHIERGKKPVILRLLLLDSGAPQPGGELCLCVAFLQKTSN